MGCCLSLLPLLLFLLLLCAFFPSCLVYYHRVSLSLCHSGSATTTISSSLGWYRFVCETCVQVNGVLYGACAFSTLLWFDFVSLPMPMRRRCRGRFVNYYWMAHRLPLARHWPYTVILSKITDIYSVNDPRCWCRCVFVPLTWPWLSEIEIEK